MPASSQFEGKSPLYQSLSARLARVDFEAVRTDSPLASPNLPGEIYADLEKLSRESRSDAVEVWAAHAPSWAVPPTYADPRWVRDVAALRDTSAQLNALEAEAWNVVEQGSNGAARDRSRSHSNDASAGIDAESEKDSPPPSPESDPAPVQQAILERDRRAAALSRVKQQFKPNGDEFHFKSYPSAIAFYDKGTKLVARSNDERVTLAMATMAEAKGWSSIRVKGHPVFRQQVWLHASMRGIAVQGYTPTRDDLALLSATQERHSMNRVEGVKHRASSSAPSEQRKIYDAVLAKALERHVPDAGQRTKVLNTAARMMDQREASAPLPPIGVFDRTAPSMSKSRASPQVQRNAERTR